MELTILHTNDLHGHLEAWRGWEGTLRGKTLGGLPTLAGAVKAARAECDGECLLLDAGDLIGDTMLADLTEGKALIAALNHLRYDAMTIGNHEPDFGMDKLRERIQEADFPVLAANIVSVEDQSLFTQPYLIRQCGRSRVGIIGLAYPKTARTTASKNVSSFEFQAPQPAVEKFLPKLRDEGAEIIVVLSHLGLQGDQQLAESTRGIDVIVGGHSHNRMETPLLVGNTLIVQAGAHGSDLGRLDLTIEDGKITAHRCSLITLDADKIKGDEAANRLVDQWCAPHRAVLEEVIGHAADWLIRAQTLAGTEARKRDEQSAVDSLFADVLVAETGADIAFLPGVGYGVAIPPGPITAAQLRQMVPHEGKVVTMRLSGASILEILEQAVENVVTRDPTIKVGGMIQVAGLRFKYREDNARDHRVVDIQRTKGEWDAAGEFLVATNSMLAQGGHNQKVFTRGQGSKEFESQYAMIKRVFQRGQPVSSPTDRRIERASDEN